VVSNEHGKLLQDFAGQVQLIKRPGTPSGAAKMLSSDFDSFLLAGEFILSDGGAGMQV
jgi:hypothetical protein